MSAPVGLEASRLCALLEAGDGAVGAIHLCADEQRAREVALCLSTLAPEREVLLFPPWDCLPYDTASPSAEAMGGRMGVLRRLLSDEPPPVVVTSPEAALQRVPPSSAPVALTVREGEALDPEALAAFCHGVGYAIDDRVDEPGEVAIRSGVIDIFPGNHPEPFRLELDGARVTAIRPYDPVTQRTTGSAETLVVDAVSELPADWLGGERPLGCEHRLAEAYPALSTLFDYLPRGRIVVASDVGAARDMFLRHLREAHRDHHAPEAGRGPGEPGRLYLLEGDWDRLVAARRPETLDLGGFELVPRFVADPRPRAAVAAFVAAQREAGRRVVLAAPTARALARLERRVAPARGPAITRAATWGEALAAAGDGLVSTVAALDRGFVDGGQALAAVAADDVLGAARGAGTADPAALWQLEATEFQIGDIVVHAERGVGRLEGVEPMDAADADAGEAIRLSYADDQDLLVPATEAGKLWRYGSEDADVSLDRLTGNAWARRREKISAGLAETARGLIDAAARRGKPHAPKLVANPADYERFALRFPFHLTPDQRGAIEATVADLGGTTPMDRLVIGDVGFGKTEVALRAAAVAAFAGRQVAVVAPTTVLARQHHETFRARFAGFGIEVAHLSRLSSPGEARGVREGIADGRVRVAVGTHALLARSVRFADLGLLVVDEEQRFGAQHKQALRKLGEDVHALTMTATPIPRTLQGALVGLQDLSVIATPPLRRRPIRTLLAGHDPVALRQILLRERRRGGQSFVVVPRVEDIAAVEKQLREVVPGLGIRVAHGQLPARAVDEAIVGFAAGDGDVLLATSIIESGLDVPRANTMVVLGPDRFGLAQLHQLRGRVGRGHLQAYCYLMTEPGKPLPEVAARRLGTLQALDRLGSGMALSLEDLDQRGAGELFGDRQAGHVRLLGLGLYQELLAAALRAERGEPSPPEVALRVGVTGTIPPGYVPEPVVRVNLYHRLARTRTRADVDRLSDELADRFGPPPPPVEALLQAARIRALAARLGATRIAAGPEGVAVTLAPGADVTPEDVEAVASLGDTADWNGERLLVRKAGLEPERALELALGILSELD